MSGDILVVDDDPNMGELLIDDLARRGHTVHACTSAEAALEAVVERPVDVVLTDLRMPGVDGIELCRRLADLRPDVPVVVMTAFGSLDSAVAAMRAGAHDFVSKPVSMEVLALTLERALRFRALQEQITQLSRAAGDPAPIEGMTGESEPMRHLYETLRRVADSDASVLVSGESGTGKELVARALHRLGRRARRPFVAVNCAALPAPLLESELFGHVRGAFTDARADRDGLFLQADGGTLFLDEIGELPELLQPKLLRALEERVVRPLGGVREQPFDVRLVAASNRDLEAAVEGGTFREDLFYRINILPIELPPLRERGADVLRLAEAFVERFACSYGKEGLGISRAAARWLLTYRWPGNVRELRNVIERAVVLTQTEKLVPEDLPAKLRRAPAGDPARYTRHELVTLEELERRYIEDVLEVVDGSRSRAAEILGIDRKTLYRKLRSYAPPSEPVDD